MEKKAKKAMEDYDCKIQHWQKSNTNKREIR